MQRGQYDDQLIGWGNPLSGMLEVTQALEESWSPKDLGRGEQWVKAESIKTPFSFELASIWKFLYYAYYFKGPVKNIVNNLCMLIGIPEYHFASKSDERAWEDIAYDNDFPWRYSHIIRNTVLWNDFLTVVHTEGNKTPAIRGYQPWLIGTVDTAEDDPEEVLRYNRTDDRTKFYEAEEVVHHRIDKLANETRGVPLFCAVLDELVYYYKWLADLYYVGHMRARIPVVRKVQGGLTDVTAESARLGSYLPGPGRVITENYGVEWQFPPQYGGITDAREGWETFCQAIAIPFNLPYFLVSCDYRNNSLASTLSADSPTVRLIRWHRQQFDVQFRKIMRKAINREVEVETEWPPVIERDIEKQAKAYEIGIKAGALSAESMMTDVFDKDPETERKKLDEEDARARNSWDVVKKNMNGADALGSIQ